MKRALHTAEIVGKAVGAEVRVENDLRECFYGDAEGKLIADLEREYPDILSDAENRASVERTIQKLRDYLKNLEDKMEELL